MSCQSIWFENFLSKMVKIDSNICIFIILNEIHSKNHKTIDVQSIHTGSSQQEVRIQIGKNWPKCVNNISYRILAR